MLCWAFVAMHGVSLVVASGGYSSLRCMGCSLQWLLLLWSMGSRTQGLQQLWSMGLIAPHHVESSQTKDQTNVPCTGRWILIHRAIRGVPTLFNTFKSCTTIGASQEALVVKNLPANSGDIRDRDLGSNPRLGRSPGGGMATHSSILAWRILMDRGAWWATVLRVAKSWTWWKWLSRHACAKITNT